MVQRAFVFCVTFIVTSSFALADTISTREARKALPRPSDKVEATGYPELVPSADAAQFEAAGQKVGDVLVALGAAVPGYGALAISPDQGLFVQWINAVGQYHSLASARQAALSYCNEKKDDDAAECVVVMEVAPKGAKSDAAFSLSASANAAFRNEYRKLDEPKAFAISPSTGNYGFARGDGARALEICATANSPADDCKIVISD